MKKIAIHSIPRSGSSWVGQIFNSSPDVNFKFQPLFSYEFKDFLTENSDKEQIRIFFEEISKSNSEFLLQEDKVNTGIYPRFSKNEDFTHVVYKEVRYHHILENMLEKDEEVIVIGVIRNPFSVINSFLKSPREFRKDLGWIEDDEWRFANKKNLGKKEEFFGFEKWKEVVILFNKLLNKYPSRFYLIQYEKVIEHTEEQINQLFDFCGLEYSKQTMEFIQESRSINKSDIYSVYRKKDNDLDWLQTLNPDIAIAINDDLFGEKIFERYLLPTQVINSIKR